MSAASEIASVPSSQLDRTALRQDQALSHVATRCYTPTANYLAFIKLTPTARDGWIWVNPYT
jgi:hypothetical protein